MLFTYAIYYMFVKEIFFICLLVRWSLSKGLLVKSTLLKVIFFISKYYCVPIESTMNSLEFSMFDQLKKKYFMNEHIKLENIDRNLTILS